MSAVGMTDAERRQSTLPQLGELALRLAGSNTSLVRHIAARMNTWLGPDWQTSNQGLPASMFADAAESDAEGAPSDAVDPTAGPTTGPSAAGGA